ncbi:Inactive pancreatic lipase-related protein 1 [Holothuria leucospilota]|uniref:Inactive pancreatic lipase-related protein 1 n=1 Tax=Holothuria leucospilota TaxID=206669 RepID=A0A9Q1BHF6_HOLLE|nr:Inactive pancreatic lipase-related protein 1 [Holothuria leucospilota]
MVDWREGAQDIYYKVRQNTRVVALEVAEMLKRLMASTETTPKELHLIGHSLGAHIAGYVGEIVPSIGRITGLDPAGPGFDENQSIFEKHCKLDPTDADFVDVVHTDGFYGNKFPLGHQDFFPNGGVTQPGCKWTVTRNLCDHLRALDLFTESITTACPFIGYPCDSWEDFENRKCTTCNNDGCPRMGFYADQSKASGLFWLGTNSESPFCLDDAGVPQDEEDGWFWWG